nr:hypothetical protein [Tanacetum cinerariifolium]
MRKKCVLLRDPVDDDEEGTRVQTEALIKDLEHRSVELKAQLRLSKSSECALKDALLDVNLQDLISNADSVSAKDKDDKRNVIMCMRLMAAEWKKDQETLKHIHESNTSNVLYDLKVKEDEYEVMLSIYLTPIS